MPTDFVKFPVNSIWWLTKKLQHLAGRCCCYFFFSLRGEPVGWGKVHLVYASTKVRDLPRCVCVCACVCGRVHRNLWTCVCVCARAHQCECMCRWLYERGVIVFQCASVSLCFVWLVIYLLQAIVFWLLWFDGVFTIRFVGSPLLLLILSGQAKYFFIPFKGTSNPPPPPTHTQRWKQKQKQKDIK